MKLNKWNSNDVHGRIMRVLLKQRTNMYIPLGASYSRNLITDQSSSFQFVRFGRIYES